MKKQLFSRTTLVIALGVMYFVVRALVYYEFGS